MARILDLEYRRKPGLSDKEFYAGVRKLLRESSPDDDVARRRFLWRQLGQVVPDDLPRIGDKIPVHFGGRKDGCVFTVLEENLLDDYKRQAAAARGCGFEQG